MMVRTMALFTKFFTKFCVKVFTVIGHEKTRNWDKFFSFHKQYFLYYFHPTVAWSL